MALYDGTNAPIISVYLDVGNRNQGKFILNYSLLGGADQLGSYTPFTDLVKLPSNDVKKISIRRGRTREDQEIQPGALTLTLDNTSGNYDPEFSVAQTVFEATGNGTRIIYYVTGTNTFKVGQVVTITGLTNPNLNLETQTITDVTSNSFTIASSVLGTVLSQAGTATTGYVNTQTPAQTMLTAGTGIRITATIAATETSLYSGFIEAIDKDLSLQPTITITCTDVLAKLSKMRTGINVNNLYDGVAVGRILTSAGYDGILDGSGNYYIVSNVPTGDALNMIDTITTTQLGMFYADINGDLIWLNGDYFASGSFAAATKWFTLTDARTSNNVVEYDEISVIGGEKYLRNTINADAFYTDGTTETFTKFNSASAGRFGPVASDVELYFAKTDAALVAQALADQFANPAYRVDQISFECVGFSSTLWNNILSADLAAAVIVKRTPIYGSELTYNCWVQQLNHDITPNSWRTSLTLSPAI